MKEQLKKALEAAAQVDTALLSEAADKLKQLPRTEEGIFDTASVDGDCFEAARWVYPVYAAFETECNKEAGYPDLLAQIRVLDTKQKGDASLAETAKFLEMLIAVIDHVTPQLYEYYRELVDIFRMDVKEAISSYYKDGSFGGAEGKASGEDMKIRETIAHAGKTYVLLTEKYREYM